MRTYVVHAWRGGHKVDVTFGSNWKSTARIRRFTIEVFRKYFGGLTPNFHWHKDGFMAGASDKRGNNMTVEQVNWWHQFNRGGTKMPRPLCPMIIERKKAA